MIAWTSVFGDCVSLKSARCIDVSRHLAYCFYALNFTGSIALSTLIMMDIICKKMVQHFISKILLGVQGWLMALEEF